MKTTILTFVLLVFAVSLQAQTSINTSGNTISSSSGNISYSLGQAFQDVKSNSSVSISEGVQQPYEITQTLGMDISEIGLDVKVFPNPTSDILNLKVDFADYRSYTYELYDSSNKILKKNDVLSKNTVLSIASYPATIYYVKVSKKNKPVKIFKIIKTDK